METYTDYQKLINKNLKQLANTKYNFLVPTFQAQNLEFLVNLSSKPYLEIMTNLTSSALFNTLKLIEFNTSVELKELAKPYLKSINQQFTNSFNQLIKMLDQAIKYVSKTQLYYQDLAGWKIKLYDQFFELNKTLLGKKILPKFLQLFFNWDGLALDETLFNQQLEQFFFNFKSELNQKTDYLLTDFLSQIYEQYGLGPIDYEQTNSQFKAAFTDFETSEFEPVVDLKTALMLFDLPAKTTFNQIQKTYKQLAKLYHPDSNSVLADQNKMEQVNRAYQILKTAYQAK